MSTDTGLVCFWQETHPKWGFLSNWYEAPFYGKDQKQLFRHMEQYFMWSKAMLFDDQETAAEVLKEKSPRKCKALGRKVKNFDGKKWEKYREALIEEGSYYKFVHPRDTDQDLAAKLLATGERELVEASPFDRIWGIGYAEKDAEASRGDWGLNLMGKILTNVRRRLQEERAAEKNGTEDNATKETSY